MRHQQLIRRDLVLLKNSYLENFCHIVTDHGDSEKLFDYRYRFFARLWRDRKTLTKLMFFSSIASILFSIPLIALERPNASVLFFIGLATLITAALRVIADDTKHSAICRVYSEKSTNRLLRDFDQGRIRIFADFPDEELELATRVLGRPVSNVSPIYG